MSETPGRRNHTRQREHVLAVLRGTDTHPTASELHERVRLQFPRISLGTVYRNLEVLVAEGLVDEVAVTHGPTRYDGNVESHHHFICEHCGRIEDLDLDLERSLTRRLARASGHRAQRARVHFYGLCKSCTDLETTTVR